MAVLIDVKPLGFKALEKQLNRIDKRLFEPAMANALNSTINKLRTESIVLSAKAMGVKRSQFVRGTRYNWKGGNKVGAFFTIRARARRRMQADMVAVGKPHNLIRFNAVATKQGVFHTAYGVKQFGKGLAIIGGKFVVAIDPQKKGGARLGRSAYGPGLAQTLDKPEHTEAIFKIADRELLPRFIQRANRQLARRGWTSRIA